MKELTLHESIMVAGGYDQTKPAAYVVTSIKDSIMLGLLLGLFTTNPVRVSLTCGAIAGAFAVATVAAHGIDSYFYPVEPSDEIVTEVTA